MTNPELEEQEYFLAFELARDHDYPSGFSEFCADFDNLIVAAKLQKALDERNYDKP